MTRSLRSAHRPKSTSPIHLGIRPSLLNPTSYGVPKSEVYRNFKIVFRRSDDPNYALKVEIFRPDGTKFHQIYGNDPEYLRKNDLYGNIDATIQGEAQLEELRQKLR